ncbi:MAG: DNA-binding protein [Deltaproteobacteria bacterium]|nr:DNA-binding protein [Deltaproteobacteria bacterium]
MDYQKIEGGFFLKLNRGEKLIQRLKEFAKTMSIRSGIVSGIGVVRNARLGYYHLDRKKYAEKEIVEERELVSLSGNISWLGEEPIVHCHVTLGGPDFQAICGHLFEAEIGITGELCLLNFSSRLERAWDESTGLNLQKLDDGS